MQRIILPMLFRGLSLLIFLVKILQCNALNVTMELTALCGSFQCGGIATMELHMDIQFQILDSVSLTLVFAKSMNLTRAQHLGFDLHAPVKKGEGVCRDARDLCL